ncbi:MAG: hypothetical protein CL878_10880 [Dehalococcoidia bacterium]|nr:hypothetical protein [Dehalococcoidia bacterium]
MSKRKQSAGLTRRRVLQGGLVSMTAALSACIVEAPLPPTPTPTPGKITVLHGWQGRPGYDTFISTITERWKAQRPDLEVTWQAMTGHDAVLEHFLETTAAELPIEVSVIAATDVHSLFDERHLRDLRFATRQPQFSEIAEGAFLRSTRQNRNAGAETFGLPVSGPASRVLAINSDLFEDAGLNPQGRDIRTWDDLDRVATLLTERQGDRVQRSGYALQPMDLLWFSAWVNTTATTFFNPEQSWANFDADGSVAALQHLVNLHQELRVSAPIPQAARPPSATPLQTGEAAIHDELSWAPMRHYHDAATARSYWQIPYPKGPGGFGANTATSADAAVVHGSIERPGHALTFLQWFCGSLEVAHLRFEHTKEVSPLVEYYQTQEWINAVDTNPVLATIPDIAEIPGAYAGFTAPFPYRRFRQINEEVLPVLAQAYRTGEGLAAALKEAHVAANTILSKAS